ncbi:MAG: hypothetical protein K2X99_03110 [Gemmatimonadaceae bacterium]|nr:hypothetical protein [Gemmatimonadaceae bacterium]
MLRVFAAASLLVISLSGCAVESTAPSSATHAPVPVADQLAPTAAPKNALGGRIELVSALGETRSSTPFAEHPLVARSPSNGEVLRQVDRLLARKSGSAESKRRLRALRQLAEASESGDAESVMKALRRASSVAPGGLKHVIRRTVSVAGGSEFHSDYPLASGARVRTIRLVPSTAIAAARAQANVEQTPCDAFGPETPPTQLPVWCGGEYDPYFDANPYEPDIAAQAAEGEAISAASDALAGGAAIRAPSVVTELEVRGPILASSEPSCRGEHAATTVAAGLVAASAAESLFWGVVMKNPVRMFNSIRRTGALIAAAWVAYEYEQACHEDAQ